MRFTFTDLPTGNVPTLENVTATGFDVVWGAAPPPPPPPPPPPNDPPPAAASTDELAAIAVAGLRPGTLRWKLGAWGAWSPTERVYVRAANLVFLGGSTSCYVSPGANADYLDRPLVLTPADTVTAMGAGSVLAYVTESDVAAVANPVATRDRMLGDLYRRVPVALVQASCSSGRATASSPLPAPTSGALAVEVEGQGYELDLTVTVGGASYNVLTAAPKGSAGSQWGHTWWGRLPWLFPLPASINGQPATWAVRVYSDDSSYAGLANVRVATLPTTWATDA